MQVRNLKLKYVQAYWNWTTEGEKTLFDRLEQTGVIGHQGFIQRNFTTLSICSFRLAHSMNVTIYWLHCPSSYHPIQSQVYLLHTKTLNAITTH